MKWWEACWGFLFVCFLQFQELYKLQLYADTLVSTYL